MKKKRNYVSPLWVTGEDGVVIEFGGSQGTTGEDNIFTWDPEIDEDDQFMFWLSYDDTDLEYMDTDHDLYISKEEFYTWFDNELGGQW